MTNLFIWLLFFQIYNLDKAYRQPPFCYYSSTYGHPYVTDSLFERITEWVKDVNVSVDWKAIQQNVSPIDPTKYEHDKPEPSKTDPNK